MAGSSCLSPSRAARGLALLGATLLWRTGRILGNKDCFRQRPLEQQRGPAEERTWRRQTADGPENSGNKHQFLHTSRMTDGTTGTPQRLTDGVKSDLCCQYTLKRCAAEERIAIHEHLVAALPHGRRVVVQWCDNAQQRIANA
jgi:hypothetical protein